MGFLFGMIRKGVCVGGMQSFFMLLEAEDKLRGGSGILGFVYFGMFLEHGERSWESQ